MITTRFPRTYKVAKSSPYGPFPPIGGLYPDALPDDHFFERLGGSGWAEELSGLQPSGFVQGSRFETSNFDLDRVREVYETIVRYIQTCGGVEIWNSDIVVSDAENPALVGNYLDLSDAFGSEFETLKNEAGTLPDWMQDTEEIRFDKNTLRPVIFIDEDQTAYMARFVTVTVTGEDHVELRADLVLSLDGETMYDYVPEAEPDMYDSDSFDPATLYGSEIQVEGARIGNKYYAYDQTRNYYVYSRSGKGIKSKKLQKTLKKYLEADGMAVDPAYMYSLRSDQWNRNQTDYIIKTMTKCSAGAFLSQGNLSRRFCRRN